MSRLPGTLPGAITCLSLLALQPFLPSQSVPDPLGEVRSLVVEALDRLNLTVDELGFEKKKVDPFTLPGVSRSLDRPLDLPLLMSAARLEALSLMEGPGLRKSLELGLSLGDLMREPSLPEDLTGTGTLPQALAFALGRKGFRGMEGLSLGEEGDRGLLLLLQAAGTARAGAVEGWGGEWEGEIMDRTLVRLPYRWLEDGALRDVVGIPPPGEADPLGEARRFDASKFASNSIAVCLLLDRALAHLEKTRASDLPPKILAPGVEGDVRFFLNTPMGSIVVGGPGETRYSEDCFLVVDFGGDDVYRGRVGAASRALRRPFSVLVDLGGDDDYRSEASLNQGAALLGIGILVDLGGGEDRYRAQDLCQGAGILGLGLLFDDGGPDQYCGRGFVQGAGAFGLGVFTDVGGCDILRAAVRSQGFGGVRGLGVLIDGGGDDLYQAGGTYRHEPLLPEHYLTLSQGFGMGERYHPASGGIGFLWDGGGNDQYLTEVYGQGAAYYMALGLLVDEGGHDRYACTQYGQGAGVHLASGGLWDLGGNDSYTLHYGVGQGSGHDLSVGILLDGAGNDYYQGSGLTQGTGGSNSVGILIDGKGNDCYAGTQHGDAPEFQGHGKPARNYGSLGLLLDVEGRDTFSHRGGEEYWERGRYGLSWDRKARTKEASAPVKKVEWSLPDPLPEPTPEVLEDLYAKSILWRVGSNVPIVEQARATMIALGPRAGRWILERKFSATRTLELRAFWKILPALGREILKDLREQADQEDWRRRRNALDLLVRLGDRFSIPMMLVKAEKDPEPRVRRKAALCLGSLEAEEALPLLSRLADEANPPEDRRTAAIALGRIPGVKAVHRLADLLADPSFTVRDPARSSLMGRRKEAVKIGLQELQAVKGRALREWLRLFGEWKEPSCREILERSLRDSKDGQVARLARKLLSELGKQD